jgi:aldose 1-epimerase
VTVVARSEWGALPDGTGVERWVLGNRSGASVAVLTLGATLQSVVVPDRQGRLANVTLGFGDLAGYSSPGYVAGNPYFGSVVGRYANRIAGGRFTLDDRTHELSVNDGPNTLHGGASGFDRRVWAAEEVTNGVRLRCTSPDGDQGFPGTLEAAVTITFDDGGRLRFDYEATTDRPTVVNLTNHSYWNLAGEGSGSIDDHDVVVHASRYTPVDATLIPMGALEDVTGTPFDLRRPSAIGERVRADHPQLVLAGGFDHNFVLDRADADGDGQLLPAAVLLDHTTGRRLSVATTEPGLQLYSGNFLDGSFYGTSGRQYRQGDGVALETQHFPDAPNQPGFLAATLRPGATHRSTTTYTFTVAPE